MSFFKIEVDSDHLTSKEAIKWLRGLKHIKSYTEITESDFYNLHIDTKEVKW